MCVCQLLLDYFNILLCIDKYIKYIFSLTPPLDKNSVLMYNITGIEVWLSLVEYYVRDVGAAGSNPVTSTSLKSSVFPILREVQSFFVFVIALKMINLTDESMNEDHVPIFMSIMRFLQNCIDKNPIVCGEPDQIYTLIQVIWSLFMLVYFEAPYDIPVFQIPCDHIGIRFWK